MKIALFNAQSYDRSYFDRYNRNFRHDLLYIDAHCNEDTLPLAHDAEAVCIFVNDPVDARLLERMREQGVKMLALRSAGYNHVDLQAAFRYGVMVANVPSYSPYAVAEHAVGLILCLIRKIHRAQFRIREGNFLLDGLMGFDLYGKTVGVVGTGKIGRVFTRIMHGFGCELLGTDPVEDDLCKELGMRYVPLDTLCRQADIISLHCPLLPETHHLINERTIAEMRAGVCLINTSRGGVIDTQAVIQALKHEKIGYLGLDVYEEEDTLFFEDHSDTIINDEVFARLLTFNNVLITGHQGYFTREAISNIARTTLANVSEFETTGNCENQLLPPEKIEPER